MVKSWLVVFVATLLTLFTLQMERMCLLLIYSDAKVWLIAAVAAVVPLIIALAQSKDRRTDSKGRLRSEYGFNGCTFAGIMQLASAANEQ